MIKAKQVISERDEIHPIFGEAHIVDVKVVDEETNTPLTNQQIYEAFQAMNIVGVHVKLHHSKLFKPEVELKMWPGFGIITAIDDLYVWLGNYEVPKQDFLEWYELD